MTNRFHTRGRVVAVGGQMDLLHCAVKESHESRHTSRLTYGFASGGLGWTLGLGGAAVCGVAIGASLVLRRQSG